MTAIVKIPFQGDDLDVIREGERLFASVRRVCEALGIDPDNQRVKLKEKPWACTVLITAHDATGRKQEVGLECTIKLSGADR
jgi:hypothetical protein